MNWKAAAACVLCAILTGCAPAGGETAAGIPLDPMLDSGNVRFAHGDPAGALAHYHAAAADDPTNAAAWFGVYMASLALGDTATAAAAIATVQRLVPDAAWQAHPHEARAPPVPYDGH